MGLNIGLYLRRSEGLIQKSKVLIRTSDQEKTKGICLYKQETHIKNSFRTIIIPPSTPLK